MSISREEFIARSQKSVPYPLGDEALQSFYDFLKAHEKEYSSVKRLLILCQLNEEVFDGHKIVIFDSEKMQRAFQDMGNDLPEEFAEFTFSN